MRLRRRLLKVRFGSTGTPDTGGEYARLTTIWPENRARLTSFAPKILIDTTQVAPQPVLFTCISRFY
jgi:hypothetical protein